MYSLFLSEYRCGCGKLLLKGIFFDGALEIRCKRCGEVNKIGNIKIADDPAHYLLVVNSAGKIVKTSDSASSILGFSHEEFTNKHFAEIDFTMLPEMGNKLFGPESILAFDNYFHLSSVHCSKDGKLIPVSVFLKLYQPSDKEKFVLLIAEVKNIAKGNGGLPVRALEFLDNVGDFFLEIDEHGIIESVSSSLKTTLGYTQAECLGQNIFKHCSILPNLIADHLPHKIENKKIENKNGKTLNIELYFIPNFNDKSEFIGYRVLGWEIKSSTKKNISA
jgi:PAS domain S-box-containing protein